jgi:hypothetical protein
LAFDKGEWRPNRRQEVFLSLPTTIFEGLYGGGNGSGKSDVLLVYALARGWFKNPKFKQVFMRRTHAELKNEIVPRSRELYPRFGATFNKTDMVWTFPREDQYGSGKWSGNAGAMIFLSHCEHEKDASNYDSMEINLYTPDEITTFTEFIYLHIGFTRVRTNDPNLPAIIRAAGMPGGIGHKFTKTRFIDPAPEGGKVIVGRGNVKRIYIHSTVADNPHADQNYAQRLQGITNEAERKARLYGDWGAYAGQVFDELRTRKYPDEPENALHVINPFDIPEWWPRIVIGDWGYRALTYILFGAISPNGRLYAYRELAFLKTKIAEWGPIVKKYIDKENPRLIKFCKSAGQDRGQEHTIQSEIELHLGQSIELTVNSPGSRITGKMMLHEYLRWKPKPVLPADEVPAYDAEYAMWLVRNKTEAEYKSYLDMFRVPEPESNIPKLQIFRCEEEHHDGHPNCCPLLIDALQAASYDKPKKDKPAEDVAEWDGDDPYDTARYFVDAADSFVNDANKEFVKVQQQERLMQQLSNTGDMTAYYRNMRTVEKASSYKAVNRYNRRRSA